MSTAWSEFREKIGEAKSKLGNPRLVWYRGHSSERYQLVPSLHRYVNGLTVEQALFLAISWKLGDQNGQNSA